MPPGSLVPFGRFSLVLRFVDISLSPTTALVLGFKAPGWSPNSGLAEADGGITSLILGSEVDLPFLILEDLLGNGVAFNKLGGRLSPNLEGDKAASKELARSDTDFLLGEFIRIAGGFGLFSRAEKGNFACISDLELLGILIHFTV